MKPQSVTRFLLLALLTAAATLIACGGGSPIESPAKTSTPAATVNTSTVTANHGMGSLSDIQLASIGNDLYALVSKLNGCTSNVCNYVPYLYKSTDSGKTWTDLSNPPPGLTSVTGFSMVSTGSALIMSGGRTSNDASVGTITTLTFNNKTFKFTPSSAANGGAWSTLSTNAYLTHHPDEGGHENAAVVYDSAKSRFYISGGWRSNANSSSTFVDDATFYSDDLGTTFSYKERIVDVVESTSTTCTKCFNFYRERHCTVALNGSLTSFGGRASSAYTNGSADQSHFSYSHDNTASQFYRIGNAAEIVPSPLHMGCTALDSKIVIFGGTNSQTLAGSQTTISQLLQVITSSKIGEYTLAHKVDMGAANARYRFGMTTLNGKVIVVGGTGLGGKLTDVLSITIP